MVVTRSQTEASFPFLDLPAELRTEIYALMLGGHIIHISFPGNTGYCVSEERSRRACICKADITDREGFIRDESVICDRHDLCSEAAADIIDFGILLVCRQVYREAAPVVFKANTFTFFSPHTTRIFLQELTEAQQSAIQSIIIYQANGRREWFAGLKEELTVLPLRNLQRIQVFMSHVSTNFRISSHANLALLMLRTDAYPACECLKWPA